MIGWISVLLLLQTPVGVQDGKDHLIRGKDLLLARLPVEALAEFDLGLALARESGDKKLEAAQQHGRANAFQELRQMRRAEEAIGEMARLQVELRLPDLAADLLRVRSVQQMAMEDQVQARSLLEELQDLLAAKVPPGELQPQDRVNLAECLMQQGGFEEAQAELELAQESLTDRDATELQIRIRLLRGDAAAGLQEWERAADRYREGEELALEKRHTLGWVDAKVRRCELALRQWDPSRLEKELEELLREAEELGPEPALVFHLEVAPLVQVLGLEQSRAHARRLQQLVAGRGPEDARARRAWHLLGLHSIETGDLDQARDWLERALAATPRQTNEHQLALLQVHLAVVHVILGDLTPACTLLHEARDLAVACEDRAALGLALHNLGSLRLRQEDWFQALSLFEQAEDLLPVGGPARSPLQHRALWDSRIAQGEALQGAERLVESRAMLTGLLPSLQEPEHRYWKARCLARLAELDSREQDHVQAAERARLAIALFQELGAAEQELELLDEVARAALAAGDGAQVVRLRNDAMRLLRRPSLQGMDPYRKARRRSLFAEWGELGQELTRWQLEQPHADRGAVVAEGLQWAAADKAQTLVERMGLVDEDVLSQARQRQALVNWRDAAQHPDLASSGPLATLDGSSSPQELLHQDQALDRRLEQDPLQQPWSSSWRVQDLKDLVAQQDWMVVEFAETRDSLLAYVLAGERLDLLTLGPRKDLEALLHDFRRTVAGRQPLSVYLAAGDRVRRRILQPILDWAGDVPARWWIVPTGSLAGIPWAAVPLAREAGGKTPESFADLRYLVDLVEPGIAPSCAVLAAWNRTPRQAASGRALLLGEPAVAPGPGASGLRAPCPCREHQAFLPRRPTGGLAHARAELVGVAATLQELQATSDELSVYRQLAREEELVRLDCQRFLLALGGAATRQALVESGGDFELIHLVAHGVATDHPATTGLWLASDAQGREFLSTADVFDLRLNARLVVLSACESAQGAVLPGEGVQSLAWAFLCAGSHGVVASQWAVSDERTERLMNGFYRELLQQEHHPLTSLTLSQRQMARATGEVRGPDVKVGGVARDAHTIRDAAHPWCWAAFQYQGEPGG